MADLITEKDYQNLPDDLEDCFVAIEGICRANTERQMQHADNNNDLARILMLDYMAVVSSAAAECGIGELNYDGDERIWSEYENFSRNVQGIITRIRIRKRGARANEESIQLTMNAKAKIEIQISKLRASIANSDIDEDRKKALDQRLDDLLSDLKSAKRFSLGKAMSTLVVVTATFAATTTISADGPQAIQNIMKILGIEKQTEDEAVKRLAPPPAPKLITASAEAKSRSQGGSFGRRASNHLDDDIPF